MAERPTTESYGPAPPQRGTPEEAFPSAQACVPKYQDRSARLREIIRDQSLLKSGTFVLSSGRESDVFFNMKTSMLDPEGANLIADEVLDLLEDEDVEFIGGLEVGAIPIVTAICVKSIDRHPIRAFIVRKQTKGHGTNLLIDGHISAGANVVVFDDVTTTGESVLQAVEAARAAGCTVSKAITIVDRLEGAAENLRAHGVELVALFTGNDFVD